MNGFAGFYLDKYDCSIGQAVAIGTEPNDAMDIDKRRVVGNRHRRDVIYV
jgi:hypothetical protein